MTALISQPALSSHVAASSVERMTHDDLRELMQSMTEVTQRLQTTHVALHQQVARLQRELAEANAALRRSQSLAALGEMAAGIAHEVRNPLASIQLYVRMLAEDLANRPPQAELCGKIEHAVVSLDAIVRDVLSFARETTIHREPTTAVDLLERAVISCEPLVKAGGACRADGCSHEQNSAISIRLSRASDQPLSVDVGLMMQALGNVIRNAIEAMTEAGAERPELRLWTARKRMRRPDGASAVRIALCVQDSGPGIPAEVRERIFNPFFTTRRAGTGLGLAIVHRIVDAHGGHIVIDNVKPTGTRVELCLPAGPENARDATHRAITARGGTTASATRAPM